MRTRLAKTNHLVGYGLILLSSVLFGSYGVWSKLMGDQFGVFYQGWVRALIVLVIIVPILIWKKHFKPIVRQDYKWFAVLIAFTIFTQVPLYYAFVKTGVATATLLFYAMFIVTSYVVGAAMMKEKITWVKLLALALAFTGMGLVFHVSSLVFSMIGLLMAAANGIASGGEVSSTKKISGTYPTLLITFYSWVAILITHLPLSLLFGEHQYTPALSVEWGAMLAYSLAGLVAFWLVIEGFRWVDASVGSLMGLAEIVWAMLFGALLFHEHISTVMIIGAVLIFAAGMLSDVITIWRKRTSKGEVLSAKETV